MERYSKSLGITTRKNSIVQRFEDCRVDYLERVWSLRVVYIAALIKKELQVCLMLAHPLSPLNCKKRKQGEGAVMATRKTKNNHNRKLKNLSDSKKTSHLRPVTTIYLVDYSRGMKECTDWINYSHAADLWSSKVPSVVHRDRNTWTNIGHCLRTWTKWHGLDFVLVCTTI